jgi:glycosyltransferase involved in cell wall biosynthesis
LRPRTICIDGFNLSMRQGTGIATYARNLNESLRLGGYRTEILFGPDQNVGADALLNEVALADASLRRSPHRLRRWLRTARRLNAPLGRVIWPVAPSRDVDMRAIRHQVPACDGFWASRDIFHGANFAYSAFGRFTEVRFATGGRAPPDVMHWTCPLPLRAPRVANLYTIHDLAPIKLPHATLENKRRFVSLCRRICEVADRIVTVSEQSRSDLVRAFGLAPERISVTYQAVTLPKDLLEVPDSQAAAVVEGLFGLDWRGYFIFFGATEPKKNLGRIVEAYLRSGVGTPLVIVSGRGWLEEDLTALLDRHVGKPLAPGVARGGIRRYDHLPLELLAPLIRGARATLLPSLYEGFGLPVLESMLLRTPVLASTAGSLPEIAGDAAILVDPYDTDAIRAAILALDHDEGLRDDLIERGVRRAAAFSPEIYARRLADLYGALA